MSWIILALLVYVLIGALLIRRSMKDLLVTARVGEWAAMMLLWPLYLRLFIWLAMLNSMVEAVVEWADGEEWQS